MDNRDKFIKDYLNSSSKILSDTSKNCSKSILKASDRIAKSIRSGGKLLLCGNGGSASDSQHIEAEFLSTLNPKNFRPALPAISLSTNIPFLTAFTNDFNYENIFSRQIEALGQQKDILLAISTSGKSKNILNVLKKAKEKKIYSILLSSDIKPTKVIDYDLAILVPSQNTQHIQETHIAIGHIITRQVEILLGYWYLLK